jgi:hypothetical protein
MKIKITRNCFVAGQPRSVGEVVECAAADGWPAVGANRAEIAADDAKVGMPARRGRPRKSDAVLDPDPAPPTNEEITE